MPPLASPWRASCSTFNAYNPALALTSAFASTALHRTKPLRSTPRLHLSTSSRRSLSISTARRLPPPGNDAVDAALAQDVQSLHPDGKGTYASFDKLKGMLAQRKPGSRPTRSAQAAAPTPARKARGQPAKAKVDATPASSTSVKGEAVVENVEAAARPLEGGEDDAAPAGGWSLTRQPPRKADKTSTRGQRKTAAKQASPNDISATQTSTNQPSTGRPVAADDALAVGDTAAWQMSMKQIAQDAHALYDSEASLDNMSDADIEAIRTKLEYRGAYIPYPDSPLSHPTPLPWVLSPTDSSSMTAREALETEIHRFVEYAQCSDVERVARNAVVQEVQATIAKYTSHDGCGSEVFGSEVTGLAQAASDIDMRFTSLDDPSAPPARLGPPLKHLYNVMKDHPSYMCVTFRYAAFPIINAQHRASALDLQIVSAPPTTPQQQITQQYLRDLPHLRTLYTLLRAALGTRGLHDVFNGGTGAYGLFIMLAAALQRRLHAAPSSLPTLTDQLQHVLSFYKTLDTEKHGLTLTPHPKLFAKHDALTQVDTKTTKQLVSAAFARKDAVRAGQWAIGQRRAFQPYLLCLQDPANPTNDLGKRGNAIKHVIETLEVLGRELARGIEKWDAGDRSAESLLLPLVGRCHEVDLERRRKLEEFGLRVLAEGKKRKAGVEAVEESGQVAVASA